jgi:ubiquinol-cytochrome c reductase cytochrome b subunit
LPSKKQLKLRSPKFDNIFQLFFWFFIGNSLLLGWLGSQVVEQPFILIGQISTTLYFLYFIFLIPLIYKTELYLLNK